jgi:hypothetical protein
LLVKQLFNGLLGDRRLKDRIFLTILPHLAQGFLVDRKQRLGQTKEPTEEEPADIFEATLTLLYRRLFAGINVVSGIGFMLPDGVHLGKIGLV